MTKILVYCVLWMFLCHLTACGWWAIGVADFNVKAAATRRTLPWPLRIPFKGAGVTVASDLGDQYWSCFYWAATTLTKVPWVTPHTWYEQAYTAVIIMIGTFTFSVIIGQVTMQIKALDMARQARSERLGKMRQYCETRGVGSGIKRDVLQWTVADQDFSTQFVGRASLQKLPPQMRAPILQKMYEHLLESFPFKKGGVGDAGINALLVRLNPIVMLRGMVVIEPNTASTAVYVLHKGCLRIALPMQKPKEGDKKESKRMRSARVSTSPVRGVKGGGLGLKSTKEFTRFRVLERPGASVGIANLDDLKALYPFHVDCTSNTQLFSISTANLKEATNAMSKEDSLKCREVLKNEHKAHVNGLKYEGSDLSKADTPKEKQPSMTEMSEERKALLTETNSVVSNVMGLGKSTLDSLRGTRDGTRQITTLLIQLGGEAETSPNGIRKSIIKKEPSSDQLPGKCGTVAKKTGKGHNLDNGSDSTQDVDDLEERTGYAAVIKQNMTANITRAALSCLS